MSVNIKSLQHKILEIAVYLDSFCKEYNITYYLMGGSALGALRHHGFIPWDDDLDVFMTFDQYEKFIENAKKHLDTDHFYLQEENTDEWPLFFTKLRMNNTTFLEEDTQNNKMHKGIYIDIMCLNNVSTNKYQRHLQYIAARLLIAQTLCKRGYETTNFIKKTTLLFSSFFVRGFLKQKLLLFVRRLNNKNTEYVGHLFGKAPFSRTSFPKAWLGEQRYMPFENKMLPVPCEAEKYLTLRFGDYMKMPDENTLNEYPVHAIFVDINKNYTEYENNE